MGKTAKKKANAPEVKKTKLNLQVRLVLGEAYAFVQGKRFVDSVSSMTLETLIKEQIEQIQGVEGKSSIRLNKVDEVDRIVNSTVDTVKLVKSLPIEAFRIESDDRVKTQNEANTPEVPS